MINWHDFGFFHGAVISLFTRVRCLAVYVSDMDRAKRFYTGILGFEVGAELGPNPCFLRSKSGNIDIYLEGGYEQAHVSGRSCRLSFFLQTDKPASECYASLKSAGVELLQDRPEPVDEKTAVFQFKDPDGNIIEVSGDV
jgi:catechol 2,3-dioxygenase-like lactoylglutathione lyase family enzyme